MELEIKAKQLKGNDLDNAIKAKQLQVWNLLSSKLAAAPLAANEIVAIASVVGKAMGGQQQMVDLRDAEIVYEATNEEEVQEQEEAGAEADVSGARSPSVFNEQWQADSFISAGFVYHQSPFSRDRMFESPPPLSPSPLPSPSPPPSPTDCEVSDPTYEPVK